MRPLACLFMLFASVVHAQDYRTDFVSHFASDDDAVVNDIICDDLGNVYAVGSFANKIYFDKSDSNIHFESPLHRDAFVSKTDRCGKLLWTKHFEGVSQVTSSKIKIDSKGNIYAVGVLNRTTVFEPHSDNFKVNPSGTSFYISKLTPSGGLIWVKVIEGTTGTYNPDLVIDDNDNLFVSGHFTGTVDLDPGPNKLLVSSVVYLDAFVVKLNVDGDLVWAKHFKCKGGMYHQSTTIDMNGNLYMMGRFSVEADFDPSVNEFNMQADGFGYSMFIVKLNNNGEFVWAKKLENTTPPNFVIDVTTDLNSNLYFTTSFKGTINLEPGTNRFELNAVGEYDILIAKLNSSGNVIWAKQLGGAENDYGRAIFVDDAGFVYSTGIFRGAVDFNPGANTFLLNSEMGSSQYISVLNNDGTFVWAGANTSSAHTTGFSITVDNYGIVTCGNFGAITDFGMSDSAWELTSRNKSDAFIQKMSKNHERSIIDNDSVFICRGDELVLSPDYVNYDLFMWSTGETTPSITVSQRGLYYVDISNCSKVFSDSVYVEYLPDEKCTPLLYVPNAFSPNNDGLNDVFFVSTQRVFRFEAQLFNLWGELVFYYDNPNFKWDGSYRGQPAPPGIYTLVITYSAEDNPGKLLQHKSTVQLYR